MDSPGSGKKSVACSFWQGRDLFCSTNSGIVRFEVFTAVTMKNGGIIFDYLNYEYILEINSTP
jgi:hypothetical protein